MAQLVYGLSAENGVPVGAESRADGVVDGSQIVYEVELPLTTNAAMGWWFSIPNMSVLGSVVSFGVETTPQWTLTADGLRYFLFFGLPDVRNRISVRVTLAGSLLAVAQGEEVINVALVQYAPVVFTHDQETEIVTYLRRAIRVSDTAENNGRLLDLFKSGLREVETYCNHALRQREFSSTLIYATEKQGPFLFAVNGRWRALKSVRVVETSGVPVTIERNGHFYGQAGLLYESHFTLGPFDGPAEGFSDDVLEALARLVGYRWDGGIFQRSGLWQSGCLDTVSRYVNREAAIV